MLAELHSRLGVSGGWCVELGAWDGKHLSNTWSLWHDQGWSAVLIEGDSDRARRLASATAGVSRVDVIEAYAYAGSDSSLDLLLARTQIPRRFELLSIDVDGDDFHLWADLQTYRPLVVVVEYNTSFPPEVEFVQDSGHYVGSSARALNKLGEQKGYHLAGLTAANLIFVDRELGAKVSDLETDLATLFDRAQLPVIYSDFAGHHFLLRPGGWGYAGISRHGSHALTGQLREVAMTVPREVRQRAGEMKHQLALRAPFLARTAKRVRRLRP